MVAKLLFLCIYIIISLNPIIMSTLKYQSILSKLYQMNLLHPVKLDLTNMLKLNKLLQNPLQNIPIIHIAGTNGKGSVALKISNSLTISGIKTGLFTSPHISSFRERIQVNNQPLTDDDVINILPDIFELCELNGIPATFFELTTILAFMKYKQSNCDAVVLETGLGGKLDATNIVTPVLSIITSIQLDHQNILGNTIDEIALHKAGIMKKGVDVLVGPGCPIDFLKNEAFKLGANFYQIEDLLTSTERRYHNTNTNDNNILIHHPYAHKKPQDIDDLNYDIAFAALKLLKHKNNIFNKLPIEEKTKKINYNHHKVLTSMENNNLSMSNNLEYSIEHALSSRPSCRFEIYKEFVLNHVLNAKKEVHIVLDIAHNEDAIIALENKVKLYYRNKPIRVVVGMSADKDISLCIPPLLRIVNGDINKIQCVQANHPRALCRIEFKKRIATLVGNNTSNSSMSITNTTSINSNHNNNTNNNTISNNNNNDDDDINHIRKTVRDSIISVANDIKNDDLCISNNNNHSSIIDINLSKAEGVLIICGSAFIMAEVRAELGINEPKDGDNFSNDTKYRDVQDYFKENSK